jgi:hypothetical protein
MTRARDRVVLGLMPDDARAGCWANDLLGVFQWADVRAATEEVDVQTLPMGAPPRDAFLELPEATVAAQHVIARVREARPATAQTAVLPVTQLQDFVSCARSRSSGAKKTMTGARATCERAAPQPTS